MGKVTYSIAYKTTTDLFQGSLYELITKLAASLEKLCSGMGKQCTLRHKLNVVFLDGMGPGLSVMIFSI